MFDEKAILNAQKSWGESLVNIGRVFLENGNYRAVAEDHIHEFYNYQEGKVLFKPTLASRKQFRTDFEGALSYFVGGNYLYPEDHGFAIRPWSDVHWENIGTKIVGDMGVAMGNYFFTPVDGGPVIKIEFSLAYTIDLSGRIKIVLHDSHLPYSP